MPKYVSAEELLETKQLYDELQNYQQVAKKLGLSPSTVKYRISKTEQDGVKLNDEVDGNDRFIEYRSHDVQNIDDLINKCNIDTTVWQVKKFIANQWESPNGGSENTPLLQIKCWFERIIPDYVEEAIDSINVKIANKDIKYPKIRREKLQDPHMLEISIFDAHFGKLCWELDSGNNYDLKIAERIFQDAVDKLISYSNDFNIDKIVFPIGQDFFHVNNFMNTTQAGTPQDVDGRFPKVFEVGVMAIYRAINACLNVAPVEILWVPGNHDYETSWYMAQVIRAMYLNNNDVKVNADPKPRKYIKYGVNLIGFTHGNEERHSDLPTIMADEEKRAWADTEFREWHIGHYHKKKETRHHHLDTHGGTVVRVLPSLCGTDSWHYKKGYVGGRKAAEAYLWSHDSGYTGHFAANIKL